MSEDLLRARFGDKLGGEGSHARVLALGQKVALPAGATVYTDGGEAAFVPLLLDGRVRVSKRSESGGEMTLYDVLPGETCVLAASAVLGEGPYPARAVAEQACGAWVLPRPAFRQLVVEDEGFRRFVFAALAARVAMLMGLVEEVAFRRLDARLAVHLLRHAQDHDDAQVTHEELARELASAREVVSRVLKEFERRGWVSLGRGRVRVVRRAELERLARAP